MVSSTIKITNSPAIKSVVITASQSRGRSYFYLRSWADRGEHPLISLVSKFLGKTVIRSASVRIVRFPKMFQCASSDCMKLFDGYHFRRAGSA